MKITSKKRTLSAVGILHFTRLVYRSILFVLLLISYISYRLYSGDAVTSELEKRPVIIVVTWGVFVIEMILRFFPSVYESPGSQKLFFASTFCRKGPYIKCGITMIAESRPEEKEIMIDVIMNCIA